MSHDSGIEPALKVGPKLHRIEVMKDVALEGQDFTITRHLILKNH